MFDLFPNNKSNDYSDDDLLACNKSFWEYRGGFYNIALF